MTPEKIDVTRAMYASRHHTLAKIAKTVGMSRPTLYRHLLTAAATDQTRGQGRAGPERLRRP
jgi:DNA-binding phage protein